MSEKEKEAKEIDEQELKEQEVIKEKVSYLLDVDELNNYITEDGCFGCNEDCVDFFTEVHNIDKEDAEFLCDYMTELFLQEDSAEDEIIVPKKDLD